MSSINICILYYEYLNPEFQRDLATPRLAKAIDTFFLKIGHVKTLDTIIFHPTPTFGSKLQGTLALE